LRSTLRQLIILNQSPFISSIGPIKFDILWTTVSRVYTNFTDVCKIPLGNSNIQVGSQSLVYTFIVFEDIFNDIVRFMN